MKLNVAGSSPARHSTYTCSSVGRTHDLMSREVTGSSPVKCANGKVAQWQSGHASHDAGAGSNPPLPTNIFCNCGTNWAYALVLSNKVRRLTFSRNLAEFIHSKNPDHEIKLLDLVVDGDAKKDDVCIFGIMDNRKGKLLRATVSWDEAVLLTQDASRRIVRCLVKEVK